MGIPVPLSMALSQWAAAAQKGDAIAAEQPARHFYHVAAALVASKEFQSYWQSRYGGHLEPDRLEELWALLEAIAEVEAQQTVAYGMATPEP